MESNTELKLCINCRFCGTNASKNIELYKCFAPQNKLGADLVDGSTVYKYPYCRTARYQYNFVDSAYQGCGEIGSWFEATWIPPNSEPEITPRNKPSKGGEDLAAALGIL